MDIMITLLIVKKNGLPMNYKSYRITSQIIRSDKRKASDLYSLKNLIQQLKLQMIMNTYDDLYSLDLFGETIEGHRNINPYNYEEVKNSIIPTLMKIERY